MQLIKVPHHIPHNISSIADAHFGIICESFQIVLSFVAVGIVAANPALNRQRELHVSLPVIGYFSRHSAEQQVPKFPRVPDCVVM